MPAERCTDHAANMPPIEECMGCNGGKWDPEAADQLIEAGYAVGITAAALRVAKAEIERLRANQAAREVNADRVRSVVRAELRHFAPAESADSIADEVAAQLGPVLTALEREQLASLRREAIADDYPAACAWIDRLLGAMREL